MDALFKKSGSKIFERRVIFKQLSTDSSSSTTSTGINRPGYSSAFTSNVISSTPSAIIDVSSKEYLEWSQIFSIGPGFNNLGNTCYLNSILQCLIYTPPIAHLFLSSNHHHSCQKSGFCSACALGSLIKSCLKSDSNGGGRSTTPASFVKNLRAISKILKQGRQEDSHEFLRFLIDSLSSSYTTTTSTTTTTSFNPINDVFGLKLQSTVTCASCKYQSKVVDPAMDISIDIKGCNNIQRALSQFSKSELLSGRNKYKCEKCKKFTEATKSIEILEPPNILCLHLKRFGFNMHGPEKINNFISYPDTLQLPNCKRMYRLYAVNVHAGNSSRSGHYYSYVKGPSGTWYCMNDSDVLQVKESTAMNQKAYILLYVAISDQPKVVPSATVISLNSSLSSINTKLSNPAIDAMISSKTQQVPPTPPMSPQSTTDKKIKDPETPGEKKKLSSARRIPSTISIDDIFNSKSKLPHVIKPAESISTLSKIEKSLEPQISCDSDTVNKAETINKNYDNNNIINKEALSSKNDNDNDMMKKEIVVKWNEENTSKKEKLNEVLKKEKRISTLHSFDLESLVKSQNILPSIVKKSKRPSNYDIEYDQGQKKKKKQRKAWNVFDLQSKGNPFTKAQNHSNKKKSSDI